MSQLYECKCNNCSEPVSFSVEWTGQTAKCPHCGIDTILFIPPNARASFTSDGKKPDEIIYRNGNVSVTPSWLMIGSTTYMISTISSLRVVKIPRAPSFFQLLICVAGVLIPTGVIVGSDRDVGFLGASPVIAIGLVSLIVFFIFKKIIKPEYGLFIHTIGQERQALTSQNLQDIRALESALRHVITMRG